MAAIAGGGRADLLTPLRSTWNEPRRPALAGCRLNRPGPPSISPRSAADQTSSGVSPVRLTPGAPTRRYPGFLVACFHDPVPPAQRGVRRSAGWARSRGSGRRMDIPARWAAAGCFDGEADGCFGTALPTFDGTPGRAPDGDPGVAGDGRTVSRRGGRPRARCRLRRGLAASVDPPKGGNPGDVDGWAAVVPRLIAPGLRSSTWNIRRLSRDRRATNTCNERRPGSRPSGPDPGLVPHSHSARRGARRAAQQPPRIFSLKRGSTQRAGTLGSLRWQPPLKGCPPRDMGTVLPAERSSRALRRVVPPCAAPPFEALALQPDAVVSRFHFPAHER